MIKSKLSLKFASAVILIVALVIVFASCKKDGGDALKGVEFDEDEIELAVGEEYDLSEILSAKPANVELPKCTYASDDKKVATVGKSNGKVKAVAAGETTVTAETPDGKYSADITVVVSGPKVAVTGITVTPQSLSMRIGETQTLAATVTPAEAADKAVTWSSGAPAVAFVNPATGEVTALSAGPAVITAATRDGDKQAFCTVTVTAATEVSGVSVSPAAATVQKGAAQQFTAAVSGSGNPAQTVTWTVAGAASSGTGVSASGLLTVAAAETASTLTVRATSTADNTKSGTAAVTVGGGSTGAPYIQPYRTFGSSKATVKAYESGIRTLYSETATMLTYRGESSDVNGVFYNFPAGASYTYQEALVVFNQTSTAYGQRLYDHLSSNFVYLGVNNDGDYVFCDRVTNPVVLILLGKNDYSMWYVDIMSYSYFFSSSAASAPENLKSPGVNLPEYARPNRLNINSLIR